MTEAVIRSAAAGEARTGQGTSASAERTIATTLAYAQAAETTLSEVVSRLDPARVVEAVIAEVADRARLLPGPDEPMTVHWNLGFQETRYRAAMKLGAGNAQVIADVDAP